MLSNPDSNTAWDTLQRHSLSIGGVDLPPQKEISRPAPSEAGPLLLNPSRLGQLIKLCRGTKVTDPSAPTIVLLSRPSPPATARTWVPALLQLSLALQETDTLVLGDAVPQARPDR